MRKYSFSDLIGTQPNVILALGPTDHHHHSPSPCSSSPSSSLLRTNNNSVTTTREKTRWSCHKDILKSSSNYFDSIFNNQFQEAEASIVFLPRGIFSPSVLDDVLYFMYTKSLIQQKQPQQKEEQQQQQLEHLQAVYMAADYLGMDNLCSTVNHHIIQTTHDLTCYCHSCTLLVPQLLSFTGPNQQNDPRLSQLTDAILKLLIMDPEKTLPTFWCSSVMASLLSSGAEMESLHVYLQDRLLEHVNKNNAIETLYGCFLAAQQQQQQQQEAYSPLVSTRKRIQQAGSKLLADHFDFYCTKYPKLLSCVDGITYSFDFLDYLLSSVLNEQMNERNACSLYKGIIRSLIIRDIVHQQPSVKKILQNAKNKTIRYIASHLTRMKELDTIDKSVIEQLAQDLVVPIHTFLLEDDFFPSNNKRNRHHHHHTTHNRHTTNRPPSTLSTSSSNNADHLKKENQTRWNIKLQSRVCTILFGQATLNFKIGQRVKLLNRPVPTFGTISYVGKLDSTTTIVNSSGKGKKATIVTPTKKMISIHIKHHDQYLGVELDRSVGSNDGSIDGKRYFTTLPNRGIFVKPSDVTLV